MPTFDLVVVGTGGGPDETNISGYLLKCHGSSWENGIIALEGGSGLGALSGILQKEPDLFTSEQKEGAPSQYTAAKIYAFVSSYLITHAHLDHVMGLVMLAGGVGGCRKSIRGTRQTLEDIESVFKPSRLWPNLASWDAKDQDFMYLYDPIDPCAGYTKIHNKAELSVRLMPLSHGSLPSTYHSSAFFIRHDPSSREFLFFGDVEPDSIAAAPLLIHVWRAAASKVPHQLDTMFIECSWPSGRDDNALYGHLTPEHLVQELENLAAEIASLRKHSLTSSPVRKKQKCDVDIDDLRGALVGLTIYVIHCKEDMNSIYDQPMSIVITEQVRKLAATKDLGVKIIAAEQGMYLEF